jgi:hypothetical protein
MKRAFWAFLMTTILVLTGSAAWSATITIYDPEQVTPVNPTVTATGFDAPYFSALVIDTELEYAHVTATYQATSNFELAPNSLPIKWLEYAGGPVSDFMIFTVSERNPSNYTQAIDVKFWSKGAADFDTALASFDLAFPDIPYLTYVEDGTPRGWSYSTTLQVSAVCGAPVPLPPTVLLLGSSFLGLIGWRRLRTG